jgi:hypothetical protein
MSQYDIKWNPAIYNFTQANATQEANNEISKPGPVEYGEGGWQGGFIDTGSYIVISDTDTAELSGRSSGRGIDVVPVNAPTFWKVPKDDAKIVKLANKLPGSPGDFTTAADAKTWINNTPGYALVTGPGGGFSMLLLADIGGNLNAWSISQELITGPVDLGIPSSNYNYYALQNGYMIWDYNTNTGIFMTSDGVILDIRQYSGNNNFDNLDDKFIFINDYDNKIFVYSDGIQVNTVDWSDLDYYDIDWNYDAATLNGGIIMFSASGDNYKYHMLNNSSRGHGIEVYAWNHSLYYVQEFLYNNGDFIFIIKQDRNNSNLVSEVTVLSNSGKVLHTTDLTGESINNWTVQFYGHNKGTILFYNYSNSNQRYVIINYDGNINSYIHTHHQRGDNFLYRQSYYQNSYANYAQYRSSQNFVYFFYDSGNTWDGSGYLVSYANFLAFFDGVTSTPTPLIFQNSGSQDKKWDYDSLMANNLCLWVMTDVGNTNQWRLLSVKPSGLSYNNSISHGTSTWTYWSGGDRMLWWDGDNTTFTIFNTAGTVLDTLSCPEGYSDIIYNGNSFVIVTSAKAKYINADRTTFGDLTLSNSYAHSHANGCEDYPAIDLQIKGNILIIDQNDWTAWIISDNSINNISLGYNPNITSTWGHSVSKNTFCIWYVDDTPQFYAKIYGLDGTLLRTETTGPQSSVNVGFVSDIFNDTLFYGLQLDTTYQYGQVNGTISNSLSYDAPYLDYTTSNYNFWDC